MKQYYECHITLEDVVTKPDYLEEKTGWIYSCINDDIDLGKGKRSYLTKHFNIRLETDFVVNELEKTVKLIKLQGYGKVLRAKVEKVVYDRRENTSALGCTSDI